MMVLRPGLGLGSIKEHIDILLSHDVFFVVFVEGGLLVIIIGDGFVEFGRAVLPEPIGVDGPQDVGDIPCQSRHRPTLFVLFAHAHVLFAMHINDYYYNTILTATQTTYYQSSPKGKNNQKAGRLARGPARTGSWGRPLRL